jgi:hypothetical protein
MSDVRELTSQWDFVTRSIARVKNKFSGVQIPAAVP